MADEILTIYEVAVLLKIGKKTAYTMTRSGELPGFKVRGQWRFRRSDIDAWIHGRVGKSDGVDESEGTTGGGH